MTDSGTQSETVVSSAGAVRSRCAFTLIEVLVVVAVIALLVGLLLPALSSSRSMARDMVELTAMRELTRGYLSYTQDHNDALPVAYLTLDEANKLSVRDTFGGTVTGEAARRLPWRIATYLDELHGVLLIDPMWDFAMQTERDESRNSFHYNVSLSPSFGVNGHFLGGYQTDSTVLASAATGEGFSTKPLQRTTEAANSGRLTAFTTTRYVYFNDPGFPSATFEQFSTTFHIIPGHHLAESPAIGRDGLFPLGGTFIEWSNDPWAENQNPEEHGNIDARLSQQRLGVTMLDGHAERLTPMEMRDMTRWANDAQRLNDPDWRP